MTAPTPPGPLPPPRPPAPPAEGAALPSADGAPAVAHAPSSADLGMLLVCLIWGANFSVVKGAFESYFPLKPNSRTGSRPSTGAPE